MILTEQEIGGRIATLKAAAFAAMVDDVGGDERRVPAHNVTLLNTTCDLAETLLCSLIAIADGLHRQPIGFKPGDDKGWAG